MPKAKAKKSEIQTDPCQVCFVRPREQGVYRRIEGKPVMLYEACKECHTRIVEATKDFGHPEWEQIQGELELEHKKTNPSTSSGQAGK